jgi:hypothetical protein
LDAIFSINEKIELIKFKQVEILKLKRNKSDEKKCTEEEEKMKTLIYELIPEINFRYIQIKKPYFTFEKNWNEDWKSLIDFLYTALASDAISKPFRESMEEIDKVWDKILAEKNIQRLKN